MATRHPRIAVTVDESTREAIGFLAKKERKTLSMMANEMLMEALELKEDLYFSRLAEEREAMNEKTYTHEEVCKNLGIN